MSNKNLIESKITLLNIILFSTAASNEAIICILGPHESVLERFHTHCFPVFR